MVQPVIRYPAEDGSYHETAVAAVRQNVLLDLAKSFPDLKLHEPNNGPKFNRVAEIILPLAALLLQDHPLIPRTTLEARPRCEAVQASDQMVCARCDLTWDVNDSHPPICPVLEEAVDAIREKGGLA